MRKYLVLLASITSVLALLPETGMAQGAIDSDALASQNLRGYTHMFWAYAIAWGVVVGWIVSIARRLGRVEKALKE